jgi:hypothetical protein
MGLRGIARVLKISVNTATRTILTAARQIIKPPVPLNRASFEGAVMQVVREDDAFLIRR